MLKTNEHMLVSWEKQNVSTSLLLRDPAKLGWSAELYTMCLCFLTTQEGEI